jgi:hypothetical protein
MTSSRMDDSRQPFHSRFVSGEIGGGLSATWSCCTAAETVPGEWNVVRGSYDGCSGLVVEPSWGRDTEQWTSHCASLSCSVREAGRPTLT